jgi:DNA polymerase III delta prime subunit
MSKEMVRNALNNSGTPVSVLELAEAMMRTYNEKASTSAKRYNALIYGKPGTGKTTLLCTARKPVFVYMFDPYGERTAYLREYIERGDIIVAYFGHDRWRTPKAYIEWQQHYTRLRNSNFFDHIATFCLDSITSWTDVMAYEIIKTSVHSKKDNTLSQSDYKILLYTMVDWIKEFMELPCDVILTGHIDLQFDAVSNEAHTSLLLPPSLKERVPNNFMEKWITRIIGKNDFKLQVKGDNKYNAETRIGSTCFEHFETPDIKALLRKAGLDDSDLPPIIRKDA